jgi:hypothetical protein
VKTWYSVPKNMSRYTTCTHKTNIDNSYKIVK